MRDRDFTVYMSKYKREMSQFPNLPAGEDGQKGKSAIQLFNLLVFILSVFVQCVGVIVIEPISLIFYSLIKYTFIVLRQIDYSLVFLYTLVFAFMYKLEAKKRTLRI